MASDSRVPQGLPESMTAQLDTSSLSTAITLGTLFLQGEWHVPAMILTGIFVLLTMLVLFLSVQCVGRRTTHEILKLHGAVALLQKQFEELDLPSLDPVGQGSASSPKTYLEPTLVCIDAKLLQLGQESAHIEKMVLDLRSQQDDAQHANRLVELASKIAETTVQSYEVIMQHEKLLNKCTTLAQEIPQINKLLQSLCLDVKKGFQLLETHGDSHLAPQREALHLLQADNKAQTEKLTKIEAASDDAKTADKQLSVDLHVCRETLKGKIETLHSEHKRFEGSTNSNFRGINPVVPQLKHLGEQCKDMLDYLVRGNQHDSTQQENMRLTMESTSNTEDRIVRVESLCAGLIDQINELNELLQQVREAQQLQQEQLVTIVERTPKLPKRAPPAQDATSQQAPCSASSNQMPTPQSAPVTLEPSPTPTPTLRLAEHLQPLVREQGRPVIMVGGDALGQPLNQFSTQDLLRALLNRGTF